MDIGHSGGYLDNKIASGLGSYHYHCSGDSAHLHKNGVCPYTGGDSSGSSSATTKKTSKYYQTSVVKKIRTVK